MYIAREAANELLIRAGAIFELCGVELCMAHNSRARASIDCFNSSKLNSRAHSVSNCRIICLDCNCAGGGLRPRPGQQNQGLDSDEGL